MANKSRAALCAFAARNPAVWDAASISFLVLVGALCVFRALTLPISTDEAFFWQRMIHVPWRTLWTFYDACHHILFTYLAKLSTAALGESELSLRLPTLLAAVLYLAGIFLTGPVSLSWFLPSCCSAWCF
ncbi:MAG: hypothetical protein WDO18_18840 [Acidobacteriota bacterium]